MELEAKSDFASVMLASRENGEGPEDTARIPSKSTILCSFTLWRAITDLPGKQSIFFLPYLTLLLGS